MSKEIKESREKRRKRKYNMLVEAGFSSSEANKYKDLSNIKVINLIEAMEEFNTRFDIEYLELDKRILEILQM